MTGQAMRLIDKLPKHKMVMDPKSYRMIHPVYSMRDIETVSVTHRKPEKISDKIPLYLVRTMRKSFDIISRYNENKMNTRQWLNRAVFLESVAGVPGMVGGMTRHLQSLRKMRHDHGWIHNLLEEAENERTHLFIFLELKQPTRFFRFLVALTQGVFFNLYFVSYLLFPRLCHRFVGYLEEEAVHTYSVLLKQLDSGTLPEWGNAVAPKSASDYYDLPEGAKLRDVILAIRADESIHRELNHYLSDINQ
jgi:hypothetical protein